MKHLNAPQSDFSDETIMAFIDGELDHNKSELFKKALQNDSVLAQKVAELQFNDARLSGSLSAALSNPMPSIQMPVRKKTGVVTRVTDGLSSALNVMQGPFRFHFPAVVYSGVVLGLGIVIGNLFPVNDDDIRLSDASLYEARVVLAAINRALENNSSDTRYDWSNPHLGTSGGVTPLKTWKTLSNQYCREYKLDWVEDQDSHSKIETACRSSAGNWQTDIARQVAL